MLKPIPLFNIYLFESSANDIAKNNEAQRVYKLVYDQIKDTSNLKDIGNYLTQVYTNGYKEYCTGVKFNLTDIGEKYDIDIILSNISQNQINNEIDGEFKHTYNGRCPSMIFPVLPYKPNISFDDNIDYINTHKINLDVNCFIHEFIHYLDSLNYSDTYNGPKQFKPDDFDNPDKLSEYVSTPEEFNAYYTASLNIIMKYIKTKSFDLHSMHFKQFFNICVNRNGILYQKLSDDYKKKFRRRVYKLYVDLINGDA